MQSGNARRCWSSGRTSKTNLFLEESFFFFFPRVSANKKNWCFFRLLGVFLCFWGVFLFFLGVFLRFWGVFVFCASAQLFFGEFFFEGLPHRNGEFLL